MIHVVWQTNFFIRGRSWFLHLHSTVGRTELGKEHSGAAAAESDSGKGLAGAQFRNDAVTSGREKQVKVTAALAISALVRVLATFTREKIRTHNRFAQLTKIPGTVLVCLATNSYVPGRLQYGITSPTDGMEQQYKWLIFPLLTKSVIDTIVTIKFETIFNVSFLIIGYQLSKKTLSNNVFNSVIKRSTWLTSKIFLTLFNELVFSASEFRVSRPTYFCSRQSLPKTTPISWWNYTTKVWL